MTRLRQKAPRVCDWRLLILAVLIGLLPMPVAAAGAADCTVAIYGSPDVQSWLTDVQTKVAGTGLFHQVDAVFVGSGAQVPSLATLQTYKSVLVFSDKPFNNKVTMGNVLADYVDNGGGLVVAAFAFYGPSHPSGLAGRISSGNYLPFVAGIQASLTPLTLVPDLPSHPLLTKVTSFHGGSASYYNKVSLASGATQVAHWSNATSTPLLASKQITAGMVVGMNFYPPSSNARSDFWQANTDGARLMANALRFAGCPNTDPVAQNSSVTVNEDSAGSVSLLAADPDSDTLTYTLVTSPTHGTLSGVAPNLTYTPAANFNGSDSLTFKVNDGWVDSNLATVTINVSAVNDAPSFVSGGNITINEDANTFEMPWASNLSSGPSDEAGQGVTMQVSNDNPALFAEQPSIHANNGHLRFTPAANVHGRAAVTVTMTDDGGRANGGMDSSTAISFTITVVSENDAPVANSQSVTLDEDVVTVINLTGSDPEGDSLIYRLVDAPQRGVLHGTAPALMFTPNANYNGSDSFTFSVSDGMSESVAALVSLTINAVNDAPSAERQTVTTDEEVATPIMLAATDVEGDAITFATVTQPANGVLSGDAPNLTYTPNANFNGNDSFTFNASDGQAASEETVTILVNSVNDAPETTLVSQPVDPSGNSVSFGFSGTDVDGTIDHFECALDGMSFAPCTDPSAYTGLTPGAHTFQVRAIDNQGLSDPTPADYAWNAQDTQTGEAQITIILDMQPDRTRNILFTGDLGSFYLDDTTDEEDDDDYSNSRTFTVQPGVYVVNEQTKKDWLTTHINCTPSAAASPDVMTQRVTITVNSGDAVTCTFVTQRGVSIEVRAYEDRGKNNNVHDGRKNKGDRYVAGWEMTVYSAPTTVITSGVTSGKKKPKVIFEPLRPGTYVVCETLQPGWIATDPAPGAEIPGYEEKLCKTVTLQSAKSARLLFGQYQAEATQPSDDDEEEGGEIDAAEVDAIFDSPVDDDGENDEDASNSRVFLPVIVR